jgi:hypothetical protein
VQCSANLFKERTGCKHLKQALTQTHARDEGQCAVPIGRAPGKEHSCLAQKPNAQSSAKATFKQHQSNV